MVKNYQLVKVNEKGERIGDSHPLAQLSDSEVEVMRRLNEGGMTYTELSGKFEVPVRTVKAICRYERRNQTVARVKVVHVPEGGEG